MFKVIVGQYKDVENKLNELDEKYGMMFTKGCDFDGKNGILRVLVECYEKEEGE